MTTLAEALKICGIKCKFCLDLKCLSRRRISLGSYFDFFYNGCFEVIKCKFCGIPSYDTVWIRYSNSEDNYENGEKILTGYESDEIRLMYLLNRINKIKEMNKDIEEKIEKEMDDKNIVPLYKKHVSNKIENIIETSKIKIEVGKMIEGIIKLINCDDIIKKIRETTFDIVVSEEKISNQHTEVYIGKDNDMYPIFVILHFSANIIKNDSWFSKDKATLTLRYTITTPKNLVAKYACELKIAEITENKMESIRNAL